MKIVTNNGIYIQKKDLELILSITDHSKIPDTIIQKYKANDDIKDTEFIFFQANDVTNFINNFSFIIDFNDLVDLNWDECADYYIDDLQKLRQLRVENDKHKFLPENKTYDNVFNYLLDKMHYNYYVPNKEEIKSYPIEMQLLNNKVSDAFDIMSFNNGTLDLDIPEEVYKPVRYTKKQLQQIYYEVLSDELSFEELKPYQSQLYSIFSRIDYTPEILNIIRKIMLINRNNTIDFINDEVLDILSRVEDENNKFENSTWPIVDYLYVIGYNKSENFNSKIVLKNDIKTIKKTINVFACNKSLSEKEINKLSKYNYDLAEIIKVLKSCNYAPHSSDKIGNVFSNMIAYVYLKQSVINNDFSILAYAYDWITNHITEITKFVERNEKKDDNSNDQFVDDFNLASNLLMHLLNHHEIINPNMKNIKDALPK